MSYLSLKFFNSFWKILSVFVTGPLFLFFFFPLFVCKDVEAYSLFRKFLIHKKGMHYLGKYKVASDTKSHSWVRFALRVAWGLTGQVLWCLRVDCVC